MKDKTAEVKSNKKEADKHGATKSLAKPLGKTLEGKMKVNRAVGDLLLKVFNNMDKDKDGFISEEDLIAHFREAGVFRNRHQAKMWISTRDLDQDGKLSTEEFLSSYLMEYDSHSKDKVHLSSNLNIALGYLRLTTSLQISTMIADSILDNVSKVLKNPATVTARVVEIKETDFAGIKVDKIKEVYLAMGFTNHQNQPSKFIYGSSSGQLTEAQLQSLQERFNVIHHFSALLVDLSLSDPVNGRSFDIYIWFCESNLFHYFTQFLLLSLNCVWKSEHLQWNFCK